MSDQIAGVAAPAVTDSGNASRPFKVNGDTFVNEAAAKQRSCDIQRNGCLDAVNGGKANGATIQQCEDQATTCNAAQSISIRGGAYMVGMVKNMLVFRQSNGHSIGVLSYY